MLLWIPIGIVMLLVEAALWLIDLLRPLLTTVGIGVTVICGAIALGVQVLIPILLRMLTRDGSLVRRLGVVAVTGAGVVLGHGFAALTVLLAVAVALLPLVPPSAY